MKTPGLKRRDGAEIDKALMDTLHTDFRGRLILPSDPSYETARRIWNASIDKHPGLIARCSGTADVISAVKFARANQLLVAVKSGGHNVAGRSLCDDGIVIDLSAMKGVFVDPLQRTVRVQAGATLADVDRETHIHGLAVPLGVISRTGVAGLTLGGGVGWLVRNHGLSCDNMLSCEVVTAAGQLVTANDETNADLLWGLRGGGGNFGIVTSFLFRAHPVSTILGGLIIHARDQAAPVLRHYRDFVASAPKELTAYAGLLSTPDGMPAVGIIACYSGDLAEGERILKPLRDFGSPLLDAVQPMPFPAMQKLLDDAFPDDNYNYWKSTFLKALNDETIDLIVEKTNRLQSPLSSVVIEFYGGAAGNISHADTAFPHRQAEYNVGILAQWKDPAEGERHTGWARDLCDSLEPYASGFHLANFISEENPNAVAEMYGSNHARLVALKTKYDPTNFFSLNQNVMPNTTGVPAALPERQ